MERFEASFPAGYRKDDIAKICGFVLQGKFCQLVCPPGGGKATLLKLLANNQNVRNYHLGKQAETTYFLYLNLLELSDFTESSIYKFLLLSLSRMQGKTLDATSLPSDPVILLQLLKDSIDAITNQEKRTPVLLLDHFDEYQNHLSRSFFQMLRSLKSLAKYRFSVVFATRRDLKDLVDPEILKEFYDFFVDNTVYMKLSDPVASSFMFEKIEKITEKKLRQKEKDDLLTLTGGHAKLLKVCTETVLQEQTKITLEDLLKKPLVRAALFELWYFDKKIIIPLFSAFVKQLSATAKEEHLSFNEQTKEIMKGTTAISDLFSPQEFRLLKFLLENKDRIIEREEIIATVWRDAKTTAGVTEQALDQLIFRLRHKIEDYPNNPGHLQTIKGRGFRFTT